MRRMILSLLIGSVAVVWTGQGGAAQDGRASKKAAPAGAAATPARVDYRVVVWYRRDRPLGSFQYQVYDVRKGDYTPAVDAWIELMRTKYPAYQVTVRAVDLSREKGQTEALKVGSVIQRELLAAAALEGIVLGEPVPVSPVRPLTPASSLGRPGVGMRSPGPIGAGPPGPTYPVPMPYPRPHP